MFPAIPAVALWEYPWASRKFTIAVTLSGSQLLPVLQLTVDAVAVWDGVDAGDGVDGGEAVCAGNAAAAGVEVPVPRGEAAAFLAAACVAAVAGTGRADGMWPALPSGEPMCEDAAPGNVRPSVGAVAIAAVRLRAAPPLVVTTT